MLAVTGTAALSGIEGKYIKVEVDSSRGLPSFNITGFGDVAVKEAADRVKSALVNSGFDYPRGRITVNLSPAWIHKKGSSYDLAMAVGIMLVQGIIPANSAEGSVFIGELTLNGDIIGVKGVLPMISGVLKSSDKIYLAEENYREGYLAARGFSVEVAAVKNLRELAEILRGEKHHAQAGDFVIEGTGDVPSENSNMDFLDVKGNWAAKEAITIAVAGGHDLLMLGPPGTGKTMMARRIPTILPVMSPEEQLETSMVYSALGRLCSEKPIISERPFRQLSKRDTPASILGGGNEPLPGEISLAHNGVLFVDEFLEFSRDKIELLRKPMEEHHVTMIRRSHAYTFPSDFILIAAANPCRCGYLGDSEYQCTCTQTEVDRYRQRLSGPMSERIDMCIEVTRVNYKALTGGVSASSAEMRHKVVEARRIQEKRFEGLGFKVNSLMEEKDINEFCVLDKKSKDFLKKAYEKYKLSPRRYYKLLKLARTIADVQGGDNIEVCHLAAAIGYIRLLGKSER